MNYRHAIFVFVIFLIFSFVVCFIPEVTEYDIAAIKYIQNILSGINKEIPIAAGGLIFYVMACLPLAAGCIYFLINKMYKNLFLYALVPFVSYFINSIIKAVVQRPRPPIELQFEEHMTSSSYVSRHTFVTACIWGIFIYLVCKYCKNRTLKYILVVVSCAWILFEGFSRVWMGVHNPTDVIGALILAYVFVVIYSKLLYSFNKYFSPNFGKFF